MLQRSGTWRWLWVVVAILTVWGLASAFRRGFQIETRGRDLDMYAAVTARVAAGEPYYRVLGQELSGRGYAVRPVFNWRLPTLTLLNARLPSLAWSRGLLELVGVSAIVLWLVVIRSTGPVGIAVGTVAMVLSLAPLTVAAAPLFYEVWAGTLLLASLGWWAVGRVGLSIAFGAAALAIRELSLIYVVVMAVLAAIDRRRPETVAWCAVVAAFAAYWLWHASQASAAMAAGGLTNSWTSWGGWPFVLVASQAHALLMSVPAWALAFLVPLAWAGAFYWSGAVGRRLAIVLTAYFAAFAIAGRSDNWYWGLMFAPLLTIAPFGFWLRGR